MADCGPLQTLPEALSRIGALLDRNQIARELRTNSFVRMRKVAATAILEVSDLGDAEKLLKNPHHLSETAHELLKRGSIPTEDGWGGWL